MSTFSPWMKFIFFTSIVLISFIGFNNGQAMGDIDMINLPMKIFDMVETRKMVSRCKPSYNRYCYLQEAAQLILFGEPRDPNAPDPLDQIPDTFSLNEMLIVGFQQLAITLSNVPGFNLGKIEKTTKMNRLQEFFFFFR